MLLADDISPRGWHAALGLTFARRGVRTELVARRHHGPLAIQRSFHPERDGTCHSYVLHPPGGVVGGDALDIDIQVQAEARALVTTPAAGKIYRSPHARSVQHNELTVAAGAMLDWLPQENIVYDGARAAMCTRVQLAPTAEFSGWEIVCLGRRAANETFTTGALNFDFELWRADTPLVIERVRLATGDPLLSASWGLAGASVIGSMYCTAAEVEMLRAVRARWADASYAGEIAATLLDDVLACRYRGNSATDARAAFTNAWSVVHGLRDRPRVLPRIWFT